MLNKKKTESFLKQNDVFVLEKGTDVVFGRCTEVVTIS